MKDCADCRSGQKVINSQRICDAMQLPKPVKYMRDPKSNYGPEGMLFEPVVERKYAEFDE